VDQPELPADNEDITGGHDLRDEPFAPASTAETADGESQDAEHGSWSADHDAPDAAPHPEVVPSENGGGEVPRAPDFAPAVSRPVAMAQVIAAPASGGPNFDEPSTTMSATKPDPFFGKAPDPVAWSEPEADIAGAGAIRPEAQLQPPRPANPPPAREGSWTREPVLFALLLVALMVLAFDTYLILRLNGLSDRLTALAGRPAVAALVPGAAAQDRPWVGLDTIRTAPFTGGGRPVTTVHFGNSGAEPAYDFRSNTVGSLRAAKAPSPDIPPQPGPVASSGVLLPNAGGTLTFFANTRPLTAQEAAGIRSGQDVLWLAGRLDYKDGNGRAHETTFRYRFNPALNGFTAAPEGNTAN
jgi:hypothetical protein